MAILLLPPLVAIEAHKARLWLRPSASIAISRIGTNETTLYLRINACFDTIAVSADKCVRYLWLISFQPSAIRHDRNSDGFVSHQEYEHFRKCLFGRV
jgi:hypothetical protein